MEFKHKNLNIKTQNYCPSSVGPPCILNGFHLLQVYFFSPQACFYCLVAFCSVAKIKPNWNYLDKIIEYVSRKPEATWVFCIQKKPLGSAIQEKHHCETGGWGQHLGTHTESLVFGHKIHIPCIRCHHWCSYPGSFLKVESVPCKGITKWII